MRGVEQADCLTAPADRAADAAVAQSKQLPVLVAHSLPARWSLLGRCAQAAGMAHCWTRRRTSI
jgi:hypothetical protein